MCAGVAIFAVSCLTTRPNVQWEQEEESNLFTSQVEEWNRTTQMGATHAAVAYLVPLERPEGIGPS